MTALYKDIAERMQGDIYIGVVGPVRTGKSTFIKRFMELFVLDRVENDFERRRIIDELPQSGAGKTIMTTQPKFVPSEAVQIELGDAKLKVRMVDCVGYMVKGALGVEENSAPRMVRTPWSEEEMPFEEAAEIGTRKVITDHSTIGVMMVTDGSITDIPRDAYLNAEDRVVRELKEQGKPFVMVLNSTRPQSDECIALRDKLTRKYDVPVLALDVLHMSTDDATALLETVLFEFPLSLIRFQTPKWVQALDESHYIVSELIEALRNKLPELYKVRDYTNLLDAFDESKYLTGLQIETIELGTGELVFSVTAADGLFYTVLSEQVGEKIEDESQLITMLSELTEAKREYDHIKGALRSVRETGYGLISPTMDELTLDEPELIKHGNQYGVRLSASGPSLHLIRADVTCEVSPTVGSEQQSEQLLSYLMKEFESDPAKIWETDIFGKSLHELVNEGLSGKLTRLPDDVREKLQQTLSRIINEGNGSMICILF